MARRQRAALEPDELEAESRGGMLLDLDEGLDRESQFLRRQPCPIALDDSRCLQSLPPPPGKPGMLRSMSPTRLLGSMANHRPKKPPASVRPW